MELHEVRRFGREYKDQVLHQSDLDPDPIIQLKQWVSEAVHADVDLSNAATLATVDEQGRPSARVILVKKITDDGVVFYTNRQSHKGQHIAHHASVALVFYWGKLDRQVRIQGQAEKTSDENSQQYFHARPYESQLAAAISAQSEVVESRQELKKAFDQLNQQCSGQNQVPWPGHWGGYHIRAQNVEFWQSGLNRLHDRFLYQKIDDQWVINRLAP